jgi:hypothetical protein
MMTIRCFITWNIVAMMLPLVNSPAPGSGEPAS